MSKRKLTLILVDLATIGAVCAAVGLLLPNISSVSIGSPLSLLWVAVGAACLLGMRWLLRVYAAVWRYANEVSYLTLLVSDAGGYLALFLVDRFLLPQQARMGFAYTTVCVLLITLATMVSRLCYQLLYERIKRRQKQQGALHTEKIPIAVVGAGNVGAALVDELQRNPRTKYQPVCFFDIAPQKIGNYLRGLPIYDDKQIDAYLGELSIREIVLALPGIDGERRAHLYERYAQTGCRVRLYDFPLEEDVRRDNKRTLRDFSIEDLLFRDSLQVDHPLTGTFYRGKRVMVTGGGGSIGAELCRQLMRAGVGELVIVDNYENNAYAIQQELLQRYGRDIPVRVYIATVREPDRLEEIFRCERPQIVLHAAAHKHVPLMEDNPAEAVKNNVLGTYYLANLSETYGVEKFLLISTDKAVNPTSVMGASKRLCEMVIQCRHDSATQFTAVRFGNVLGSNGSVIPLFKKQIAAGGPVTLTDKRIVRYFMTVTEAVGLVMETAAMAKNGELYVLDMGKSIKILDLAEKMIRLSGLVPYEDIDIVEIGLRPGEKLYEELLLKTEELDKTDNDMIFIERDKGLTRQEMDDKLALLREALAQDDGQAVRRAIRRTVPTFREPEELNGAAQLPLAQ